MSIPDPTLVHINNPGQFEKELEELSTRFTRLRPFIRQLRGDDQDEVRSNLSPEYLNTGLQLTDSIGNAENSMTRFMEMPTLNALNRIIDHYKPYSERAIRLAKIEFKDPEALSALNAVEDQLIVLFHEVERCRPKAQGRASQDILDQERSGRSID